MEPFLTMRFLVVCGFLSSYCMVGLIDAEGDFEPDLALIVVTLFFLDIKFATFFGGLLYNDYV